MKKKLSEILAVKQKYDCPECEVITFSVQDAVLNNSITDSEEEDWGDL